MLAKAQLTELDLSLATQREVERRKRQATNRRTVQKGGHLSVDEARDKIDQKAQLAAEKAAAKAARALKKQERATAQALHQAGIKARKAEREEEKGGCSDQSWGSNTRGTSGSNSRPGSHRQQ